MLCLGSFTSSFAQKATHSVIAPITLDQLEARIANGKDTTYIINFWATWCIPCIKELPYFEQVHQDFQKKPVKVILVSLDFKSQLDKQVVPFLTKKKYQSEVMFLDEDDQQVYIDRISPEWSGAIPATLFINRIQGKRTFHEGAFTQQELNTYLNKNFNL